MNKFLNFIKNNILVLLSLGLNVVVLANAPIGSNSVSYTNSKTNETTVEGSLDELFSAVDINEKLGNTNEISSIGNGTVSNAISTINTSVTNLTSKHSTDISNINTNLTTINTNITNLTNKHNSDISTINTSLSGKQATITGGASTIASSNLTTNRALISNGSGKVAVSGATSTELGYLSGVTSSIQTQLNTINNKLTIARGGITGHDRGRYVKKDNLVFINGLILMNGASKTITLPYTPAMSGYFPIVGLDSNLNPTSGYTGYGVFTEGSKNCTLYLTSANTYGAVNFTYLTS